MADAIVSVVLEKLVTIIYEQAKQEVRLVAGVGKEIQNLTSNFQTIQAVLEDAERREVKEGSVRDWVNKLKEASYDLEDVLDQWRTALLRLKIKQQTRKNSNKVLSFLSSPCFRVKQVASRRDIAIKIKELQEKLHFIIGERDRFNFVIHERIADTSNKERSMTTSFINVGEVHGRKEDKTCVKDMLLSTARGGSSSSSSQHEEDEVLRVISIVGMGGIGKTTLVQSVYNDDQVKDHFELKIWICVSDIFDERRIALEILERCSEECPRVNAMDIIMEKIRQHISKKRFLLVLDDVWTEEVGIWDQLMNTLKCVVNGSRILLTTRNEKVAMVLGSRKKEDVFPLRVLMEEDSWSLFSQIAFHDKTKHEKEMLEGVGRKIIDKCEGLPLAIKIIASHLRFKRSIEEWQLVLTSDTWKIKDAKKDLFGPLLLSYHELPSAAKQCFMYLALFPKDYDFKKKELIRLWMAQGYCGDANDANECFNDLAMRCFFQDFRRSRDGESFKMHDIVHDFTMLLSEGQTTSIDFTKIQPSTERDLQKSTRHMSLNIGHTSSFHFPQSIDGWNNLRSMHIECTGYSKVDLSTLTWGHFMLVRTLKLKNLQFEVLPDEIRKLELLRYLDLSDNKKLSVLPEAICDLCNLQTLDITGCGSLSKLPVRIDELTSLIYLRNSATDELKFLPKEIGRLSNVKEIHNFVVSSGEKDANLADLASLPNIEYISISGWENIGDVNVLKKERFEGNSKLRVFGLDFNTKGGEKVENEKQEQVLQALIPPSCVEELHICNFIGRPLVPTWVASLNNLKYLVLKNCVAWEQLPALGKLPTLEELCIADMKRVKKVGVEFLGTFPNLKTLEFSNMEEWEDWEWSEEEHLTMAIMPHLMELHINLCDKLTAIPWQLLGKATLEKLRIGDSRILENRYGHETGVDWRLISHIPQVEIYSETIFDSRAWLESDCEDDFYSRSPSSGRGSTPTHMHAGL